MTEGLQGSEGDAVQGHLHLRPLGVRLGVAVARILRGDFAAKYKNIKIIVEGDNNFDPNTARTLTKSLVQAHPYVNVITSNGDLARGRCRRA